VNLRLTAFSDSMHAQKEVCTALLLLELQENGTNDGSRIPLSFICWVRKQFVYAFPPYALLNDS
jgi:hypothetical protein